MNEDNYTRYSEPSDEKENEIWKRHIGGEELPEKQEV